MIRKSDAAWAGTKRFLEGRIETLQRQLEADATPEQTAVIRGRIREIRRIIGKVEPRVTTEIPPDPETPIY